MIGIDIVDVSRFQRLYQDHALCSALFTDNELTYIHSRQSPEASAAGIFAAKEAYCKAVQLPLTLSTVKKIEIRHTQEGCPILRAEQITLTSMSQTSMSHKQLYVSISHAHGAALAVVIAL